jgi:hypothetical protein
LFSEAKKNVAAMFAATEDKKSAINDVKSINAHDCKNNVKIMERNLK